MIETAALLFDPLALLLVGGGTLAATFASSAAGDFRRGLAALRPLLKSRPEEERLAAERAVRNIQRISEYRGIPCVDRVRSPVEFVRTAACRLADAEGSEAFRIWAEDELEARRVRHESAISVWARAAEVAPAMGMIGTVVGLVGMFAAMSDPAAMGPAMATAMLTTLYGLLIAACVAGPVAARLERLSAAERRWQVAAIERLERIARAEEEVHQLWRSRRAQAVG